MTNLAVNGTSTLTGATPFNFSMLPVEDSWTGFLRNSCGSSAARIYETITPGTALEIKDNKFKMDSFIILRRSDFEKLVKSSIRSVTASSQIKRCLISITETTQSYSYTDPTKAEHVIKAISNQAQVALELATIAPVYDSNEEFFRHEAQAIDDEDDDQMPTSKAELKRGTKRR